MTVRKRFRYEVLTAVQSRTAVRASRALSTSPASPIPRRHQDVARVVQGAVRARASECDELEHALGWRTPQRRGVWTCTGRPASRGDLPWAAVGWFCSLVVRPPWVVARDVETQVRALP